MAGTTVFPTFHRHQPEITKSRMSAAKINGVPLRLTCRRSTYILVGMLRTHAKKPKLRDPERTREDLLQAAFREVHRSGFQSAGIDTILAATNVTKGALYYHFNSKDALGYAVVDEVVAKIVRDGWLSPLLGRGQPIDILIGIVRRISGSARRHSNRLSAAQFGNGNVSGGREVPQAPGEDFFCLAGRSSCALAKRTVRRNSSPRPESRGERQFSGRHGRGLRFVGEECSRCQGVGSGNEKHRGVVEVTSRAASISKRRTTDVEEACCPARAVIFGLGDAMIEEDRRRFLV